MTNELKTALIGWLIIIASVSVIVWVVRARKRKPQGEKQAQAKNVDSGKRKEPLTPTPMITPTGNYFDNVFKAAFWDHHMVNVVGPQLVEIPKVRDADIFAYAYRAFVPSRDSILEAVRRTAQSGKLEVAWFHKNGSSVCLLITALPWATQDVTNALANSSGRSGFGYGALLDSALSHKKPEPCVTHWLHISLTMVDARFHLAAGQYVGSNKWEAYCHPVQLVGTEDGIFFRSSTPIASVET